MTATVSELAGEQFVLLTTFRRDATAVSTPVWAVPFDGGLGIWTGAATGKVKRIRRDGHVTVSPCDRRGHPTGPEVPATATLLDRADAAAVRGAVARKYGVLGRILVTASTLRRGVAGTAGIVVRAI